MLTRRDHNEFTNELIEKAKEAESVEELTAMAKEAGTSIFEEDAEKYYEFLHSEGKLSDEELSQVDGGKGEKTIPRYGLIWRV